MTWARARGSASPLFLLSLLCVTAIASCRTASEPPAANANTTDSVISTVPPFKTKEPERYSATRTITIFPPSGDQIVTRTFIARDGPMRREESEAPRRVYLDLPDGRFVLFPDEKTYAFATRADASSLTETEENSPDRLLHTEPISTTYQSLGNETIGGRNALKYRIVVNKTGLENVSQNETFMWIDEALTMPIKSETKSPNGTRTVMELSDVTLEPDKQLFEIPADYKKVGFPSP